MGFVIDSPVLARRITAAFDDQVPLNARRVQLTASHDLVWEERREERTIRHRTEPGTGFWQRMGVSIASAFPIDPLL